MLATRRATDIAPAHNICHIEERLGGCKNAGEQGMSVMSVAECPIYERWRRTMLTTLRRRPPREPAYPSLDRRGYPRSPVTLPPYRQCVVQGPTGGLALQDAYPRNLVKQLAARAGIEKRVHPHGLRHTYASYLLDRGVPIHYIRRVLGHTSIAITERYADHINAAVVVEELRQLAWPDG